MKPYFNVDVVTSRGEKVHLRARKVSVDWDENRIDEYEGDTDGGSFLWQIKQ